MKKIVFENEEVVSVNTLTNESFVGILWNDKEKAIVILCPDKKFRYLQSNTNNVKEETTSRDKLKDLIVYTKKVDTAYKQAFIFDTYQELLTWLVN